MTSSYTYACQYGPDDISSRFGVPQPSATVTIYVTGTLTLASLWTTASKGTPGPNPLTTDSLGNLTFFADPGVYDVSVDSSKFTVMLAENPNEAQSGTPPMPTQVAGSNTTVGASTAFVTNAVATATAILDPKPSVNVVATTNQTISGLSTIDGISVTAGMRVLLTGQSTSSQNGIWIAGSGAWARPTDYATGSTQLGAYTLVLSGTLGAGQGWILSGNSNITVDSTNETWVLFSTSGNALQKANNLSDVASTKTAKINVGLNIYSAVTDYAVDNTGVNDCGPAINTALVDLVNSGNNVSELFFPPGTYYINTTVNDLGPAGSPTIIFSGAGEGRTIFLLKNSKNMFQIRRPCYFRDMTVDFNGKGGNGILIENDLISRTSLVGSGTSGASTITCGSTQQISITGGPTGGTFTLTWNSLTTAAIPYNAPAGINFTTPGTVLYALGQLAGFPNSGAGAASASGGPLPGTAVSVYIPGSTFNAITANSSGLTGGSSPTVNVTSVATIPNGAYIILWNVGSTPNTVAFAGTCQGAAAGVTSTTINLNPDYPTGLVATVTNQNLYSGNATNEMSFGRAERITIKNRPTNNVGFGLAFWDTSQPYPFNYKDAVCKDITILNDSPQGGSAQECIQISCVARAHVENVRQVNTFTSKGTITSGSGTLTMDALLPDPPVVGASIGVQDAGTTVSITNTGTITLAEPQLLVMSAVDSSPMTLGSQVTVAGAGAAAGLLTARITDVTTANSKSVYGLSTPGLTAVAGAAVTNTAAPLMTTVSTVTTTTNGPGATVTQMTLGANAGATVNDARVGIQSAKGPINVFAFDYAVVKDLKVVLGPTSGTSDLFAVGLNYGAISSCDVDGFNVVDPFYTGSALTVLLDGNTVTMRNVNTPNTVGYKMSPFNNASQNYSFSQSNIQGGFLFTGNTPGSTTIADSILGMGASYARAGVFCANGAGQDSGPIYLDDVVANAGSGPLFFTNVAGSNTVTFNPQWVGGKATYGVVSKTHNGSATIAYDAGSFVRSVTGFGSAISTPAPTTGTKFQISALQDAILTVRCTTSVAFTLTYGPSTGAENTYMSSVTGVVGAPYSLFVPAGNWVVFTGTVADFVFTAQTVPG